MGLLMAREPVPTSIGDGGLLSPEKGNALDIPVGAGRRCGFSRRIALDLELVSTWEEIECFRG
ncbi:hypothetical protein FJ987_25955 [Mesorhizobium sp. CU2]|uniref:hypothetical protein n=1 Tax=unclassified Mesorhizobium TaxID=325217 RepID=UPI00112D50F2|nr:MULTISPECIES: hypothetical protein [unclassified Mesorhizobium]TPN84846.1 hypothetical protein FJ988_09435 [Mesorhizobium sp. CU3]TPO05685.1 hypothetical protein FJ987_25955 [Mesorhizobium sp. CU2]